MRKDRSEKFWERNIGALSKEIAMADENRVYTSATVEEAIQQMEVQAVNFAYRFIMDARVRSEYEID